MLSGRVESNVAVCQKQGCVLYISSERADGWNVGTFIWSTVGRSTSQSELGSVSIDRDGGGEFDGVIYMSVVALQEKVSGI